MIPYDVVMRLRALLAAVVLGAASVLVPGAVPAAPAAVFVAAPAPALFVAAHPDDETLAMGVAIAEHVAAGQEVHVLILTDGEGSGAIDTINGTALSNWWGVLHNPAAEGYAPLTPATMAAARVQEARTALACLAAGLPGTLTFHQAHLPDGGVTQAAAQAAILVVADEIAPGAPVRIKTHTHIVDNHPDHLAAGLASRALKAADPARFSDLRHYIEPPYWSDSRLSQVAEIPDTPADAGITSRVFNASRAYGAWAPASGAYAIGYHSVYTTFFAPLLAAPKSLVHP